MRNLALLLIALSCTASSSPLPDRLRAAGLHVTALEQIEQPFFNVPAHVYRVEGGDLQVYEYPDAAAAERDAARVSPNGAIGGSMPLWIAPPHFFRRDNVIALYLGSDQHVLDALRAELGPPFAGETSRR